MQLLSVYTGFIMQAVLGGNIKIAGGNCPSDQKKFDINFNMTKGSMETQCSSTSQSKLNRHMVCGGRNKCINETCSVLITDQKVRCDIEKPSDLKVTCFPEYDSNPTTCSGTRSPVNCTLEVECSANNKRITISCMSILVPTSIPRETSTPSTTTSATTTVTSSSESTTAKSTTISISTDISTVYGSTRKMSLTHPATTTSVGILVSSSSDAVIQASTASNTATLVGGVAGGVLAGVVITMVVVVVWWKCRRRSEIQADWKKESHIYQERAPVRNSDHGAPTAVPDVIKVSQAARDTSPIPDFRSENKGETSGQDTCSQGDYTYIKEVELDEDGAYSLGKGFPNTVSFKDLAKSGIDSGRLGAHAVTSTPQTDTYNRIGGERKDDKIIKESDEMHPPSDYFVLESSTDQEDTYNRLTAGDEPCGQHHNSTYNRIGETDVEHRESMDQELTLPDYLILEKADIPGTQDDYNRLGYVSSETSSSNLKNTYNRIGDISFEEERGGPSPEYFILENDDSQGN